MESRLPFKFLSTLATWSFRTNYRFRAHCARACCVRLEYQILLWGSAFGLQYPGARAAPVACLVPCAYYGAGGAAVKKCNAFVDQQTQPIFHGCYAPPLQAIFLRQKYGGYSLKLRNWKSAVWLSILQWTLVIVNAWIVNNLSLVNIFGDTDCFIT